MPQAATRARVAALWNLPSVLTLQWMFCPKRGLLVGMDTTTTRERTAGLVAELARIQGLSTGQLRTEFERLSGRPTGSWNRTWLVRKVSWLAQEAARQASDGVGLPTLVAEVRDVPRSPNLDSPILVTGRGVRDPQLPRPGTEIAKVYRGLRLTVRVLEGAYQWNGQIYRSLTAIAKAVSGQPFINGKLFFGVTKRHRGKGRTERRTSR